MGLSRLDTTLEALDLVPAALDGADGRVVVRLLDGDVVTALAALAGRVRPALGVWLEVGPWYPATMAARDAATLSRLVDLDTVVVAASERADEHAAVVVALLGASPVDFANDVVALRGAYNRPGPPRALDVWSSDDGRLRRGGAMLGEGATTSLPAGRLTRYVEI